MKLHVNSMKKTKWYDHTLSCNPYRKILSNFVEL
jgi:hypothetical protein